MNVQVIYKDTLSGLGTQVDFHCAVGGRTHLGLEHKVELTYIGPVAGAAYGAYNAFVQDDLLEFVKVTVIHGLFVTLVQGVTLGYVLQYVGAGGAVLGLIERVTETLGGLGNLFFYLLVILGYLVLNKDVGAVTLFGIAVVNKGVVECVNMT